MTSPITRLRLRRLALVSLALSLVLFVGPALLPYPAGTLTTDLRWAVLLNDLSRHVSAWLGTFSAVLVAALLVTSRRADTGPDEGSSIPSPGDVVDR